MRLPVIHGPRKAQLSGVSEEADGTLIFNQKRRLDRWVEYFQSHFLIDSHSRPVLLVQFGQFQMTHLQELRFRKLWTVYNWRDLPVQMIYLQPCSKMETNSINLLTNLFENIWLSESVPLNWGESTVIPIFRKGKKTLCDNHRGISLTPVITKLLASIILHRLIPARENYIREQQAGVRPGRGCIEHMFTLRQHLERRNTFHRPTIVMFLDLKAAFDSVDREALFHCMLMQGVSPKYVNILKALYSHTAGRVRVYGQLSRCLIGSWRAQE